MVTREIEINNIKKFVKNCTTNGLLIEKVLLFGSVLSGNATENSDIDVMIFSDKFSDDYFENIRLYSKSVRGFHNFDVKAYNTKKYYGGDLFIDEVKKDCLEISI